MLSLYSKKLQNNTHLHNLKTPYERYIRTMIFWILGKTIQSIDSFNDTFDIVWSVFSL